MARIALEKMRFFGLHGFYEAERRDGNTFEVDVVMEVDSIAEAGGADELGETVDYEEVYNFVKEQMGGSVKLLETLVLAIGEGIVERFAGVAQVRVRVSKLAPPLEGEVERTWVEEDFVRD